VPADAPVREPDQDESEPAEYEIGVLSCYLCKDILEDVGAIVCQRYNCHNWICADCLGDWDMLRAFYCNNCCE